MFEALRNAVFSLRRGRELNEVIRDIQKTLILSDVDVSTVKELTDRIKKRIAEEHEKRPGIPISVLAQYIIIEEIKKLFGEKRDFPVVPQRMVLVGLFGAGKTTTAAKLAYWFRKRGLKPLLVSLDVYRPGAREQLKQLGEKAGIDVYVEGNSVEDILKGVEEIRKEYDVVIYDTAGRSSLEKEMVEELKRIKLYTVPEKTLLVIPADMGVTAGREAERFNREVGIDGIVISKFDGSGRAGGALVSVVKTGVPVYFIGTGEKIENLEPFDPERLIERLLGLDSIKRLIEEVRADEELIKRLEEGIYDINTFYLQLKQLNNPTIFDSVMSMFSGGNIPGLEEAKKKFKVYDAIYKSMTKQERANPDIINDSRIRRIARGSGTKEEDVRAFLRDFRRARKMVKKLRSGRNLRKLAKQLGLKI